MCCLLSVQLTTRTSVCLSAVTQRGEQVWIPGHAGHPIDAMFIPAAASGATAHRPVVIICNPNGGLYEFHHLQMDWIKFYGDLDVHVLLYNYRGYGRNTGTPSPLMHNLDALAIVEYLKTQRCVTKIAVHGESIGVRLTLMNRLRYRNLLHMNTVETFVL